MCVYKKRARVRKEKISWVYESDTREGRGHMENSEDE